MGYHSECAGKQKFEERAAAHKALRNAKRKGLDMNAYCCDYCQHFHIGNRVNKKLKENVDKYFRQENKKLKTL